MNYYVLVLLMYFHCQSVIGQIPPIFGSQDLNLQGPPIFGSQSVNDLSSYIINDGRQIINTGNQCYCTLTSSCTGFPLVPGRDNFNIRIVNTTTNPVCGRRKVAITSGVGDVAPYGSFPWQAAIFDRLSDQYIGAGVIITSTHILTAAHKVYNLNNNFRVRLGLWTLSASTYPYFEAYPLFTDIQTYFNPNTLQNDIAIIQLDRAIPFSNYVSINTACLPTTIPAAGTRCFTAGWGVSSYNNGQYQNPLREVEVPIVAPLACETRLRNTRLGVFYNLDRTSFICAGGEPGRDACTGDGGGALVCEVVSGQYQVVGLTAWGVGCGTLNVPGIYVNVYSYLTWIRNYVSITANAG
ncbi:phenoloxidase-activating factor 2-like isoform X2 [Leptopilina boulardi]|uniref:phenoloxidase-activating factor 2-like isoform X2 n=1 Tax=Leptopilina boulardi TaxID=63433 RepID=UPI0021F515AA|nr:phenoloxidase-activating factor 2-like isoform X2 [Leptopilina boulardi]